MNERFGFAVGAGYDSRHPLVIDPGVVYSTYLGGSLGELPTRIAVDGLGNAYVTGLTVSHDFPTTLGAFSPSPTGAFDVFVAKLNAAMNRPSETITE